ncbi:hypothetical protein A4G99_15730 [Haladaptatus sp. R4]|uniref:DUF1450 domain-containing protein n=1 Tax=Haladaptatus sp. R4 TaxID=1679489 RepID=UPI0007B4E9FC|nr:DUF1450 domain-containing protein [Haladaptatus sp. R4]KZN23431.1 hypothetical protein A4G99_15730 [Haladaptatus sp. R4]
MSPTIEYCLSNVEEDVRCRLREVGADEHPCLEHCGICYARPFLVVDGTLRDGDDHEELLDGSRRETEER